MARAATFDVVPGSGYSLAETLPDGWQQTSASCSDGSPLSNIDLSAGETVTCTFVNRQLATLIVRKVTDPSPDPTATAFGFTAGGGLSPATFSLANGASRTFSNLAIKAGYSLAETVPRRLGAPARPAPTGVPSPTSTSRPARP